MVCAIAALVAPASGALGAAGVSPVDPSSSQKAQAAISALGERAQQVAQLTRDAAGGGTGRESGPFVVLVTVSVISSFGVGVVAARRRRVRVSAPVRNAAQPVSGPSPAAP